MVVEKVVANLSNILIEENTVEKLVVAAVRAEPRLAEEAYAVALPGRLAKWHEATAIALVFPQVILSLLAFQLLRLRFAYLHVRLDVFLNACHHSVHQVSLLVISRPNRI